VQVTDLQLEPILQTLVTLDWVGRLEPTSEGDPVRYVLLVDPQSTVLDPLIQELLLPATDASARLWQSGRLSGMALKDAL
jgi:membrane protein